MLPFCYCLFVRFAFAVTPRITAQLCSFALFSFFFCCTHMHNIAYLAYPFRALITIKNYNFCRTYFVSHKRVETSKKAPEFARFLQTDVKMFQGVPFFSVWKANMSMPMDLILYSNVVCFLQTYIKGPHPVIKGATNYTIIIHLISFYTYFSYNI